MANTYTAAPQDGNARQTSAGTLPGTGFASPQIAADAAQDSLTGNLVGPTLVQLANKNYALAAGSGTTPVTIKASAGYLHAFVVTTTATAALSFYDNASAASGTVLYTTASNIAGGTIIVLNMPFANGLTVSQASGSMAATIAYI